MPLHLEALVRDRDLSAEQHRAAYTALAREVALPSPGLADALHDCRDGGDEQHAADPVRDVVNWYSTQIAAERRIPVPDDDRIEELNAGRQAALEDQQRLATADPHEAERIADHYAARLKELKES